MHIFIKLNISSQNLFSVYVFLFDIFEGSLNELESSSPSVLLILRSILGLLAIRMVWSYQSEYRNQIQKEKE